MLPSGRRPSIGITLTVSITVVLIAFISAWDAQHVVETASNNHADDHPDPMESSEVLESPFKDVIAMVRWNSDAHPERMPVTREYAPFFHSLHFSMPKYVKDKEENWGNLTHDNWEDSFVAYKAVADLMEKVLNNPETANVKGILYYHFDLWIDPLRFQNMDFNKMWFPISENPRYMCIDPEAGQEPFAWWAHGQNRQDNVMRALSTVKRRRPDFVINDHRWCTGWADVYYIPRVVFEDFIYLSALMHKEDAFHEIAVATMVQVIDESRQTHPSLPIVERLGDCWGNCCADHPTKDNMLWHRCGHKITFTDNEIWPTHFHRLSQQASLLGKPWGTEMENSTFVVPDDS